VIGVTMLPELWMVAQDHSRPFASERFSRRGETFCYLKIDGSDGLDGSAYEDREGIEQALDGALAPAQLGCVVGGGTGVRYSYIDLALTDVAKGIEVLRKVLRAGRIPNRTWVQFFDSPWRQEWVGIYDDTPAPPREAVDEEIGCEHGEPDA
jgi:hypothetical protein